MKVWTVPQEISIHYIYSPNTGGAGKYGGLDLTLIPNPNVRGVDVELGTIEPDAVRWFPHIEAGFAEYAAVRADEGKPLGALHLLITKVYCHELDTSAQVMRRVAKLALDTIFDSRISKYGGGHEIELPNP